MQYRLSSDVKNESSLLYTPQRDIHDVGIVFLQMVLGLDVMERYPEMINAIRSCKSAATEKQSCH
jgi:eukaryotic translation initiation factor 2-alpha kinase 4